jgi:HEPN domain-containing protein
MASAADLARRFLALAEQDCRVFEKLADDSAMPDAAVGFFAQQAAEKCLKAVLVRHGVEFRRTHDLAELLDALADATGLAPPHADTLDELNPYAVEFRYGLVEPHGLDRPKTRATLHALLEWARTQVV